MGIFLWTKEVSELVHFVPPTRSVLINKQRALHAAAGLGLSFLNGASLLTAADS